MDPNLTTIDFRLYAHWIVLLPMIGFLLELLIGKYWWRKGGMFATDALYGIVHLVLYPLLRDRIHVA
jgi:membrane protein YdbS with pleckstrin-like domain